MGFLSSLFGSSKSQPSTSTVIQSQKLPPEIAPAVKKVVDEAEAIYDAEKAAGYIPYEGATLAPFTAEEEAAQAGLAGLVGTQQPFIDESLGLTRAQTQAFTPEIAQQFMSPYQRAVTDIEKREAQRVFERDVQPALEAQAIQQGGGMSGRGTRAGIQASEAQRNQSQLLADIEAKGLQSAFQDARSSFEQQKAREANAAAAIGRAGAETFKSGLAEQGVLQTVGEEKRDLAQSALDEEYFKFLEEREFPQQRLSEYSGFVYGNPLNRIPTQTRTVLYMVILLIVYQLKQVIQLAHPSNLALADNFLALALLLVVPFLEVMLEQIYLLDSLALSLEKLAVVFLIL